MEETTNATKVMLDAADVSRLIGRTPHQVRLMARRGKLPSVRDGSAVRFPRLALERFFADKSREALANVAATQGEAK